VFPHKTIITYEKGTPMKRILAVAMAATIVGVFAVNAMALEMSAGVKGGLALANMTGKDATQAGADKKMLLGADAGGVFNINFMPMFGAELDLLYSMKGVKYTASDGSGVEEKGKLAYLDIPLLAKFIVPMEGVLKPTVFVGPSFGILLSSKDEVSGTGDPTLDGTTDEKEHTKSLDIGLVAGVGAEIGVGSGNLLVDVRYSMGFSTAAKLTDAEKAAGATDADIPEMKNSVIAIMVGYAFKF
jgi:hypothetical protein